MMEYLDPSLIEFINKVSINLRDEGDLQRDKYE